MPHHRNPLMTTPSSSPLAPSLRSWRLRFALAAVSLGAALAPATAAAQYQFRQSLRYLVVQSAAVNAPPSEAPSQQDPAAPLSVRLSSATLPQSSMGQAYSVNLADWLTVTGGNGSFDSTKVNWTLSGALPLGLSHVAGTLTGTVLDDAPVSFSITASYEGQSSTELYSLAPAWAYSLVVDGEDPAGTQAFTNRAGSAFVTKYGNAMNSGAVFKNGAGSVYLDGAGDYLRMDGAFAQLTNRTAKFTMEGWFYPTSTADSILLACNHSSATIYNQYLIGTKSVNFHQNEPQYSKAVPANQWSHIAATYDGSTAEVYVNGKREVRYSFTMPGAMSGCVLAVGAEFDSANGGTPGNYFKGYVDDIKFTPNLVKYTSDFTPR